MTLGRRPSTIPPLDDERRVVAISKGNLARPAPSLTFRLAEAAGASRVVWEGASAHTATQLLAVPSDDGERSVLAEAETFLTELLAAGPVPSKDARRRSREAGCSDATLRRAKERLGVASGRRGGLGAEGAWVWRLRCSTTAYDAHLQGVSALAPDAHLRRPGNGQGPVLPCAGCRRPVSATVDADRPGWWRFACPCGRADWVCEDDPALVALTVIRSSR